MNMSFIQTTEGMVVTAILIAMAVYLPMFSLYRLYFSAVSPEPKAKMKEMLFLVVLFSLCAAASTFAVVYHPTYVSVLIGFSFVIWAAFFWNVFTAARGASHQ